MATFSFLITDSTLFIFKITNNYKSSFLIKKHGECKSKDNFIILIAIICFLVYNI
jgi:hypothetical protein